MRAMILAAGRGQRMRPLTDDCPKPLLKAGPHRLIEYHLYNLADAGFSDVMINHAWLGDQITTYLGDGQRYGLNISYSSETPALETAGAISKVINFFQEQPFLVINGDIWTDWSASNALPLVKTLNDNTLAHLILVSNPDHKPKGDFILLDNGVLLSDLNDMRTYNIMLANSEATQTYTFSGIGIYQPRLFADVDPSKPSALGPLLRQQMATQSICGSHYQGLWFDIGTPDRLNSLDNLLNQH